MALRSPSSIHGQDRSPHVSLPAESSPPASQDGSSNGALAKADIGKKTKEGVDDLFAKLEKQGVEIDDKRASIIDDGIARIKAEAARENINEPKRNGILSVLHAVVCIAVGFIMGVEWYGRAVLAGLAKRRRA